MKAISEKRDFIMGIAILWIMLFHFTDYTSVFELNFFRNTGYGGVDIFILLSGFGCYYSLKKDEDTLRFFKRRLSRILPAYIPFIIIYMAVRAVTGNIYGTEIIGNLMMTGWWNGSPNQFNWYIDAIILYYLLAPIVCLHLKRTQCPLLTSCMLMIVAYLVSLSFTHGSLLIAICRLPVFVLGAVFARYLDDDAADMHIPEAVIVTVSNILILIGFILIRYLVFTQDKWDKWRYGLFWYPFILIVPGLCIDLGYIGRFAGKIKATDMAVKLIGQIGKASFELFLIHMFVYELAAYKAYTFDLDTKWKWYVIYIFALILGYGYYRLITAAMDKYRFRTIKNT